MTYNICVTCDSNCVFSRLNVPADQLRICIAELLRDFPDGVVLVTIHE